MNEFDWINGSIDIPIGDSGSVSIDFGMPTQPPAPTQYPTTSNSDKPGLATDPNLTTKTAFTWTKEMTLAVVAIALIIVLVVIRK